MRYTLVGEYALNASRLGTPPYTVRRITEYVDLPMYFDTQPDANGQCVLYVKMRAAPTPESPGMVEKQIYLGREEVEALVAAGQEFLRRLDEEAGSESMGS